MKIFSSFDTEFKNQILEREQKKYWKDNVKTISYGRFYYYFFVLLPAIFTWIWAILYLVILFVIVHRISDNFIVLYYIVWLFIFLITFVPLVLKLIKRYIDYILDFLIVNPRSIIYYNQEWILHRKWRTIDNEKIKTITVEKKGLLRSILNFWNIVILTEWDEVWWWEIKFYFLDNPDKVKQDIFNIINTSEDKTK